MEHITRRTEHIVLHTDPPRLIDLRRRQHLATSHPFTVYTDRGEAIAEIRQTVPDYEPPEWDITAEAAERARERQLSLQYFEERMVVERLTQDVLEGRLSGDDIIIAAPLFDPWEARGYSVGDIVEYDGLIWVCILSHEGNPTWAPEDSPSLWERYRAPGEVVPWEQPGGNVPPFAEGAEVTHNGRLWRSNTPDNVWEPGVFGWDDIGPAT